MAVFRILLATAALAAALGSANAVCRDGENFDSECVHVHSPARTN